MRAIATITMFSRATLQRTRRLPGRGGAAGKGGREVFVDTAPLLEKPLPHARASAGKASTPIWCRANLAPGCSWARSSQTSICRPIHRRRTIADVMPRLLPDVCPTGAFPAPYQLRRAALHFLPHDRAPGPIPREFRIAIGNRIYGCDDCLAVCPWNKFASEGREAKLAARADLNAPPLAELACLDDASFRSLSPAARSSGSAGRASCAM
jgi:epoxyqueuosine reductase